MKNMRQKKSLVVLISILALCLIVGAVTLLVLHRRENGLQEQQDQALQELYDNAGRYDPQSIVLSNTTKARAEELAAAFGAKLRITADGSFAALTLPEGVTVFDIYKNEEYRKYITYMSLDYQAKISDLLPSEGDGEEDTSGARIPVRPQYTVSDTDYDRQTYLDYLNMSTVWGRTQGSGITVAVIDTGIDTDHPEFAGRISEYSYNATEDKIVKDYKLSDGAYDWSLIEDEQGHGTAVAGVIAASMDGNGTVGIAPQVNIVVIKAECNQNGSFKRTSDLVFGLYYAIERNVAVVNMSFGIYNDNFFEEAAQLAVDSDVICVAAAGNDGSANPTYPAADKNVLGVGALAEGGWELATYSNYGENVDLVAPGTVYTTLMGGGYGSMNGTSLSAPVTTGALALYLSQNPNQEFRTVEELLYASCFDLGDLGSDFYYGYGSLDVSALILEERGTVTFNMMTDELDNTRQLFVRAHTLQNIPEPERLYAVFDGWYYDPQCTEEYVWYEDEFHSDLTLYAGWVNEDDGVPYTYVELEDGTIEIRSYTGHRRYITIPDFIDGKVVSSIGECAFIGETRLREVKLPKYLKRIRRSAFEGCSDLVSVTMPDTVTEIGAYAFFDNVRLSTLIFGQDSQLTGIGEFAFSGCAKMRTFTVPAKVTALNATAFYRNTAMIGFDVQEGNTAFSAKDGVLFDNTGSTLVCYPAGLSGAYTVPEKVQAIGDYAFACGRLSGIELSGVESLGYAAFIYGSLEEVVIPDSVTSMGGRVFAFNRYLRSVKLGTGLTGIPEAAFCQTALTSVEIPAGIQFIGGGALENTGAFEGIGSLAEVTFASNSRLTGIEGRAFLDSGVVSVEIPASVMTIGQQAFAAHYYPFLSSLTFGGGSVLRSIGTSAFEFQYRLTSVELPGRLISLGGFAFEETGLTTVSLPASLDSLGDGAFASCHALTGIFVDPANTRYRDIDGVVYNPDQTTLVAYPAGRPSASYEVPHGVTDIGRSAFYGSWNLQYVYFKEGLRHIHPRAFYDTQNIERIDLPDSVEILDEYSFFGCGARQYSLSQNLKEIKMYALSNNGRLTSVYIPAGVTQISNYAFYGDRSLSSVTFAENCKLPRISYGAFSYCGLASFRVPASVSTVAQGAFEGCDDLRSFTFAENSQLTSISAYMFDGCFNLETITFEAGSALTSIQAHGLEGMRKLTKIDFGNAKLTEIDNFAFRFCESLTSFDIPEGVTSLGRYAFYYCTELSEVSIPSTVDFIGRYAFLGTKGPNIYFTAETLPSTLAEDWDHGTAGYYLGVTDVSTEGDWKYAKLTKGGISIIRYSGSATDVDLTALELGGDIVNIGGGAFADSPVERVILPETLEIIQAEAFYHSALKSLSLPAGVTFIGRSAFAQTPLETLTFAPDAQIRTIEQSAFEKTEKLESAVIPASVTALGRAIFKNSGITSLSFAEGFSMTEIPEEAFAYTHISAVVIPDSVTLVNHNAFREIRELKSVTLGRGENLMIRSNVFYRTGLERVYLPENVGYVGEYAFVGLSNLTEFAVAENNPWYKAVDGLLLSANGRKLIAVPAGRTGSLTLPDGVEVIGFGAFEDSRLSEVIFPEGANILSFGYRAFYNADGITEMRIPASTVAIDYYAFAMCDNLQRVTFAEGNSLAGVYEGGFYGCSALSDILLPDSIVEISDFAFYGCRRLTYIPVSETTGLKGIYDYAFAYAGLGGDFTTPETLIDIGPYAFMGNKFVSVTVPDTNAWDLVIGIGAFEDCNELTEITVPFIGDSFESNGITWLGHIFGAGRSEANATYMPESLKKVTVSEGITFVGAHAFDGLAGLEEVSLPHSIQTVYEYAFNQTTARYCLTNAVTFVRYGALGNPLYEMTREHLGRGITGNLILAEGMTSLAAYGCQGLTGIDIPATVRSLDFSDCDGLTDVTVPEGVQSVSFYRCSSLIGIELPDSVTDIGRMAFMGCDSLSYITIPEGVTSIQDNAFEGCGKLAVIYNNSSLELEFGSAKHGRVAYYATVIVDRNGNRSYRQDPYGPTYVYTQDGFCYTLENGAYRLVRYLGKSQTVTLPTDINGNPYEICCMEGVKNVVIPEGMTDIGASAFYQCGSLTSIVIPDTVTSIGDDAFFGCSNLVSIALPRGVKSIGDNAFAGCESLTDFALPDTVTGIGSGAFQGCSRLTGIELPDGLTSIGKNAFFDCDSLTDVVIPDGVTAIGEGAFSGCDGLTSVTVPESVTALEKNVFSGCVRLTDVSLPKGLTSIGASAFSDCSSLTSISVPDGVTGIGEKAFSSCVSLTAIRIPDGVTFISNYVLSGCAGLARVEFGENSQLERIGYGSFRDCASLTSIAIPDGVWSIEVGAFENCTSLTAITVPNEVMSISENLFAGCRSLTNVTLGAGVSSISKSAFTGCPVTTFTVDAQNKNFAFKGGILYNKRYASITYVSDTMTEITIPATLRTVFLQNHPSIEVIRFEEGDQRTYLANSAFAGCANLKTVILPDGLTSISASAFSGCSSLQEIQLPAGVKSIGENAFVNCSSLTELVLPAGLTGIGARAFAGCSGLTEIILPNGVTSIGVETFTGCSGLTDIAIPDGVTFIGANAFSGCVALTGIVLPADLQTVGASAFAGCRSLTSVHIPDGVTSIPDSAFKDCVRLTGVGLGENSRLTGIGAHAFYGCEALTGMMIPNGVTTVGDSAFKNCYSLTEVKLSGGLVSIGRYAFENCGRLASLEIPDGVSGIGDYAFRNCIGLTGVRFGADSRVSAIGSYVFYGCGGLAHIDLPQGLMSIGASAFEKCDGLTSLTLPEGVTQINPTSFVGCQNLRVIYNNSGLKLEMGSFAHGHVARFAQLIVDRDGNKTYRDEASGFEYVDTVDGFRFMKTNLGYVLKAYIGELETVTLPLHFEGSPYGMSGVRGLRNAIVPEGMTRIESGAFAGCSSLVSIVLPDGITSIGNGAFSGCSNLTAIVLPDSVVSIDSSAFSGCQSLTGVVLPDGITAIESNVFSDCAALRYVSIPNGVTRIDFRAFAGCDSLTEIVVPDSVTVIGDRAFEGCDALREITLPDNAMSIGSHAFEGTAYANDSANWDGGVLYIGNYIIRVSEELTYMVTREGVVGYADGAFENCYRLKTAVIKGNHPGILGSVTNLETLTVTEMPAHGIDRYFGSTAASVPWTLKSIVLGKDVRMSTDAFGDITGITVYVQAVEADVRWDENYSGWSNANRVIYGDKWKTVTFYDQDGEIAGQSLVTNQQIIRQPYQRDYTDGVYRYVFVGFDLNRDGTADPLPATSSTDISARAVYRREYRCVQDGHTPGAKADCLRDQVCEVCGAVVAHRLGHGYNGVTTQPTCTEQGYTTHTCSRCGDTYVDGTTPALGHDYDSVVTQPTCTEQGYTTHTCKICQYRFTDTEVPATGHTPGDGATCYEHQYCLVCGNVLVYSQGHTVITQKIPASCISQGYTVFSCARCDWGYTSEFTPFGDHVAGEEADCVNDQLCTVCGTILTELLDHDYTSRVTAPTCTNEGYTTHTCTRCGDRYKDSEVTALGHTPGAEADCLDHQTCTACGTVLAEKLDHDYQAEVTPPTCDSLGYTTHTCTRCGDCYTDEEISAFGHTVNGEADCVSDQICTVCDKVLVERLGHDYTEVFTPPTCTEGGYTAYTCNRCEESHKDGLMDPRGHNSGEWIVDREPAPGVTGSRHTTCTVCGVTLETQEMESLPAETTAEPETDTATEPVTRVPVESEAPTEADSKREDPSEEPTESDGCSGAVSMDALCLVLLVSLAALFFVRRRDEIC